MVLHDCGGIKRQISQSNKQAVKQDGLTIKY